MSTPSKQEVVKEIRTHVRDIPPGQQVEQVLENSELMEYLTNVLSPTERAKLFAQNFIKIEEEVKSRQGSGGSSSGGLLPTTTTKDGTYGQIGNAISGAGKRVKRFFSSGDESAPSTTPKVGDDELEFENFRSKKGKLLHRLDEDGETTVDGQKGKIREYKAPTGQELNPKSRTSMMKGVYAALRKAGMSDKQAKSFSAEVGRENDFSPKLIFGGHVDPHNRVRNSGMVSWQGSRGKAFRKFMTQKGMINKNGRMQVSQAALDAQAEFVLDEINNSPSYKKTKKHFLGNPDIDPESAASILGQNYYRWRFNDPKYYSHHNRRRAHYNQLTNVIDNDKKLIEGEKKEPPKSDVAPQGSTGPTALPKEHIESDGLIPSRVPDSERNDNQKNFALSGTAKARGTGQVDPRLVDIVKEAGKNFPMRVRLFSGKRFNRSASRHDQGLAVDVRLYDQKGNPLPAYQSPETFKAYEALALEMRKIQQAKYPRLNNTFRWGGGFGGMQKGGAKGKYGAADLMHFDLKPGGAMAAYKWPNSRGEGGLRPGYEHYAKGDLTGIDGLPTKEDLKKLQDFVLSKKQADYLNRKYNKFGTHRSAEHLGPALMEKIEKVAETEEKTFKPQYAPTQKMKDMFVRYPEQAKKLMDKHGVTQDENGNFQISEEAKNSIVKDFGANAASKYIQGVKPTGTIMPVHDGLTDEAKAEAIAHNNTVRAKQQAKPEPTAITKAAPKPVASLKDGSKVIQPHVSTDIKPPAQAPAQQQSPAQQPAGAAPKGDKQIQQSAPPPQSAVEPPSKAIENNNNKVSTAIQPKASIPKSMDDANKRATGHGPDRSRHNPIASITAV